LENDIFNEKWMNINKERAWREISQSTHKTPIKNAGKCLDHVKCREFNEIKVVNITCI
jgi:hypothetical protein